MAARRKVRDEKAEYLNEISDEQLACRADRHDFPRLVPGKPPPPNFRARPQRDGSYLLTKTCNSCGKELWALTPGGVIDGTIEFRARYPRNWKVVPRDVGLRKKDCMTENFRRCMPAIEAAAAAAPDYDDEYEHAG